jgi:hypothetical protein
MAGLWEWQKVMSLATSGLGKWQLDWPRSFDEKPTVFPKENIRGRLRYADDA